MRSSNVTTFSFLLVAYFSSAAFSKPSTLPSGAAQSSASEWKEYVSGEGKFTVLLPGIPTTGYKPIGTYSPVSVTYVTNLQLPPVAFLIEYFDLPAPPSASSNVKTLLDETRDRVVKSYSMKSVNENDSTFMNYPERQLKGKLPNGEVFLSRMLLVKQRVYQIAIVVPSDQTILSYITRYFDSFRPTPLTDDEIKNLKSFSQSENEKTVPRRIRFSEEVLQAIAIKKVQPAYPIEPKAAGISGEVKIEVLISEEGKVIEAKVVSGPEQLHGAAIQAAKQWEFKPRKISSRGVKVIGVLTFKFRLK